MSGPAALAGIEDVTGGSGVAPPIEALLPIGVRHRQLRVRTLLLGMMLTLEDGRPAHLTRVHQALTALPAVDQARPGIVEEWKAGPHQLTCRQAEYTFNLVTDALAKDEPDGAPSGDLARACGGLLEASIPAQHKDASAALAAGWTDVESWSRPPPRGTTGCADPEAHWGHRNSSLPGPKGEMFFGYYLSAATMTRDENGPPVPGLARRMTLTSCALDPVRAFAKVLTSMPAAGIPLSDILDDSGYAHRDAEAWAIPLRQAGAQLIQDLHPSADPRAPTTARSSPTGTCTARRPPGCCWNSGRCPPPPPPTTSPRTTSRPPSWQRTSPEESPPTTPAATTASCARRSWGRSAARSGPSR